MQAWRVHAPGEPQHVLRLDAVEVPEPGPGQALVEVEAAGVNFADVLLCRGGYQERPPHPFTPGLEVAGRVLALGPRDRADWADLPDLPVGERVVAATALPAGGFAEQALVPVAQAHPIPDELPADIAAATHVTYQTAWFALHRLTHVTPDDTVVVHGATGGLGTACVRLAVTAGARVVATAHGAAKTARALALGADVAVDTAALDTSDGTDTLVQALRDAVGPDGARIVLDPVGGDLFEASTRCIAFEGTIVVLGAAGGTYAPARTNHLLVKNYAVSGLHWGAYRARRPDLCRQAQAEIVDLWRAGGLVDDLSRRGALADLPDLLDDLIARRIVGKAVLEPHR